jgi:DNA-binding CsgD family transcriptional regulator
MHWVCEDKTNSEIATILGVTIHAVNRHLEHILSKLGVESRQKAMIAVQDRAPRLR